CVRDEGTITTVVVRDYYAMDYW
nr:immunoglobulin heavy chain junction region [Mus musculus]